VCECMYGVYGVCVRNVFGILCECCVYGVCMCMVLYEVHKDVKCSW